MLAVVVVSLAGGISKVTPSSACKGSVALGVSGVLSSAMVDILCEELILFIIVLVTCLLCVGLRRGVY